MVSDVGTDDDSELVADVIGGDTGAEDVEVVCDDSVEMGVE